MSGGKRQDIVDTFEYRFHPDGILYGVADYFGNKIDRQQMPESNLLMAAVPIAQPFAISRNRSEERGSFK